MKNWEIIAAALAILGGVWGHLQMFGQWMRGLVVAKCWADTELADAVASFLVSSGRDHSREPMYGACNRHVRPLGRVAPIAYEVLAATTRVMWRKRAPLWVTKVKESPDDCYQYAFSYIRGTLNWSEVVREALEWSRGEFDDSQGSIRHHVEFHHGKTLGSEIAEQRNKKREEKYREAGWGRANGRRLMHWTNDQIGGASTSAFTGLALSAALQALVAEIQLWHKSRKWYANHGVAWRRGFLLEGMPGSGKTSFARAIAEDRDLPVHVFDLASMSNEDMREAWSEMLEDVPCMALIEDIDAVFDGRDNIATGGGMMSSGGLTFDALLNCIDGVQRIDGVLLIVTTNHPENIDPALFDRPGRIDRVIHFEGLDHAGRLKVASRILGEGETAERAALEHGDLPAAKFVEACCRVAIASRFGDVVPSKEPYR